MTEVRRRDRADEDATIREIDHWVKNNLQTVAPCCACRPAGPGHDEARSALTESMRRVASIALVTRPAASVDERVDIDDVLAGVVPMMNDVVRPGSGVEMRREGRVGVLPAVMATPLVMVVTELFLNALEHGFGRGRRTARIVANRRASRLLIEIVDDGRGLPEMFSLERAPGRQIVRTLVDSELDGTLSLRPGAEVTRASRDPAATAASPVPAERAGPPQRAKDPLVELLDRGALRRVLTAQVADRGRTRGASVRLPAGR